MVAQHCEQLRLRALVQLDLQPKPVGPACIAAPTCRHGLREAKQRSVGDSPPGARGVRMGESSTGDPRPAYSPMRRRQSQRSRRACAPRPRQPVRMSKGPADIHQRLKPSPHTRTFHPDFAVAGAIPRARCEADALLSRARSPASHPSAPRTSSRRSRPAAAEAGATASSSRPSCRPSSATCCRDCCAL